MKIKLSTIVCLLLIFQIAVTLFIVYSETQTPSGYCLVSGDTAIGKISCDLVKSSSYAFIFGIQVSQFGLVAFTLLFIFFLFSRKSNKYQKTSEKLFVIGTIIGTLFSIYLIIVQGLVIKAWCSSCLIVDLTMICIGFLTLINLSAKKQNNS